MRGNAGQCAGERQRCAVALAVGVGVLLGGDLGGSGLLVLAREGFGEGEEDEEPDDGTVDGEEPLRRAPAPGLGEDTAKDGGDEGATEGTEVEVAHGFAALMGFPDGGDDAGAEGLR